MAKLAVLAVSHRVQPSMLSDNHGVVKSCRHRHHSQFRHLDYGLRQLPGARVAMAQPPIAPVTKREELASLSNCEGVAVITGNAGYAYSLERRDHPWQELVFGIAMAELAALTTAEAVELTTVGNKHLVVGFQVRK
jgi:hypothetical protein